MIGYRRSPPLKVAFNLSLVLSETGLAVALFRTLAPTDPTPGPGTWLAAYAAAFAADLMGAVADLRVIAARDGGVDVRSLLSGAGSLEVPALAVTLGLVCVISLAAAPTSAWLLLAFGVLLLLAFRTYASLAERHLNLERLYRFSQAVGTASELDEVMRNVLDEARELLHVRAGAAAFTGSDGELVARVRLDASGRLTRSEEPAGPEDAWVLDQVVDGGAAVLMPRSTRVPEARRWLAAYAMRDAVVVPLNGANGIVGALVVADRLGDVRTFEDDDALLLETVANHASVALRNGELIGRLQHDALHDALTGLPNRSDVQRRLTSALAPGADGAVPAVAVMILDLDEFKQVNETLGHQQGDNLLREVALRLEAVVGTAGTVARLGSDEFAVLVPGATDEDRVAAPGPPGAAGPRAARRPRRACGSRSARRSAWPSHRPTPRTPPRCSSAPTWPPPTPSPRPAGSGSTAPTSTPTVLAGSPWCRSCGRPCSRARWRCTSSRRPARQRPHRRRRGAGPVAAPVARSDRARRVHPGRRAQRPDRPADLTGPRRVAGRLRHVAGEPGTTWASRSTSRPAACTSRTSSSTSPGCCACHGVAAEKLTLEVTEGSVMADPTRSVAVLHRLRDLGVRLSVDDFGTGYSSLSYLHGCRCRRSRSTAASWRLCTPDSENVAIVRAIIDLGRNLGLEVVAEGVEDQATWDLLTSLDCDLVQGWHLARAMPIDDLLPWLVAHEAHPPAVHR